MLLLLLFSFTATAAYQCPGGVERFSSRESPSKYYQCGPPGSEATLMECEGKGFLFDGELGECVEQLPQSQDGYHSRVAMGEIVKLGSFYDVRKGVMYNGFNFWSEETISAWTFESEGGSSNTEFYVENNAKDKTHHFDIGAQLELDFLAGLLAVKGSAQYLMDNQATKNTVRMVMKSERVDSVLTLDSGAPMDFS